MLRVNLLLIFLTRNINFILFFKIERNRSYEMSSFSETAAFNLHKGKMNFKLYNITLYVNSFFL